MPRNRDSIQIGETAEALLARVDPSGKRHKARAAAVWAQVAGEEIAQHTRGFAVRGTGELVVFVDNATWASELTMMAEELRGRLAAEIGPQSVRSIRFIVSNKVAEETRWEESEDNTEAFYQGDEAAPAALSEQERLQVAHIAQAVKDPELREIAARVMTKDLERKKSLRARGSGDGRKEPPETLESRG
jgi:hypothetical protein